MSPVGHSLTGLAIGALATRGWRPRDRAIALAGFVVLANLPDAPLPGWGHDAYHVSHSLAVTLALIATAGWSLRRVVPTRLLLAGGMAWLSHLLLDSFYNHGLGIEIGWPITSYRLNLPIPWLQTLELSQSAWSERNLSVGLLEALTFGPFLIACWLLSRCRSDDWRRRLAD